MDGDNGERSVLTLGSLGPSSYVFPDISRRKKNMYLIIMLTDKFCSMTLCCINLGFYSIVY